MHFSDTNNTIIGAILMSVKILCCWAFKPDKKKMKKSLQRTKEKKQAAGCQFQLLEVDFEHYLFCHVYLDVSNCPVVMAVVLLQ